jgi:hypothetical protein
MASLANQISTSAAPSQGAMKWPTSPKTGEGNLMLHLWGEKPEGGGAEAGAGDFMFPCPKEVRSTYGLDYSMTDLALYNWGKTLGSSILDLDPFAFAEGMIDATAIVALKAIPGETIGQGIMRDAGAAINPHSGLLFNSVKPRVFNLTFECVARNSGDMAAVQEIHKILRADILPKPNGGQSGVFWDYPKTYKLAYVPDAADILPVSKACHITDLDLNFTGQIGTYITAIDDKPIQAIMSITLAETSLINREDVEGTSGVR